MSGCLTERLEAGSAEPKLTTVAPNWDNVSIDHPRATLRRIDTAPAARLTPKAEDESEAVITLDMMAGGEFDHFILKGAAPQHKR
ncbi:hypothetical protein WCLP8_530006 [uncultured Gammaproteobacteria bacterium]